MPSHVALLRGINVGGRARLAMADLRAVVSGLGHTEVATYLQTGNVVFSTPQRDPAAVAARLQAAISARLGIEPRVVVLTGTQLAEAIAANPFPDETEPKALHAVFRQGPVPAVEAAAVQAAGRAARDSGSGEDARLVERVLYLRLPGGIGRSRLAAALGRSSGPLAPAAATTARNWATVCGVHGMCGPGRSGSGRSGSGRSGSGRSGSGR